jgi:hypothetical protein
MDLGLKGFQVCTAMQMNKAIPLLLKIQNNTSVTPQILEEIKDMREDIQPENP